MSNVQEWIKWQEGQLTLQRRLASWLRERGGQLVQLYRRGPWAAEVLVIDRDGGYWTAEGALPEAWQTMRPPPKAGIIDGALFDELENELVLHFPERLNCPKAGQIGHQGCGWCPEHRGPSFACVGSRHSKTRPAVQEGRWTCPACARSHCRGPLNGADTYRCLYCGYTGTDGRREPVTSEYPPQTDALGEERLIDRLWEELQLCYNHCIPFALRDAASTHQVRSGVWQSSGFVADNIGATISHLADKQRRIDDLAHENERVNAIAAGLRSQVAREEDRARHAEAKAAAMQMDMDRLKEWGRERDAVRATADAVRQTAIDRLGTEIYDLALAVATQNAPRALTAVSGIRACAAAQDHAAHAAADVLRSATGSPIGVALHDLAQAVAVGSAERLRTAIARIYQLWEEHGDPEGIRLAQQHLNLKKSAD